MSLILDSYQEMKQRAKSKNVNMSKTLKSELNSKITYNKQEGELSYILELGNVEANLPIVNGIDFKLEDNMLILSSSMKFYREFTLIVEDIYENIKECNDSDKIVKIIKDRLSCWRSFIGRELGLGLTSSAELGLFGELLTLKELMLDECYMAVKSWSGPLFKSKDFKLNNIDIEVKTTLINEERAAIHIHGAEQLHSDKNLFLHVHFLKEDDTGNELEDLINSIIEMLNENEVEIFMEKLIAVGYSPEKKYHSGRKLRTVKSQFYKVEGKFPRYKIIPGISGVEYKIDLESIKHYKKNNYK